MKRVKNLCSQNKVNVWVQRFVCQREKERKKGREGKKRSDNNKTVEQGKHWRVAWGANSTNFAREEKSRGGGNTRYREDEKKVGYDWGWGKLDRMIVYQRVWGYVNEKLIMRI